MNDNLATLKYASKASGITNKLVKNDDPGIGLIKKMQKQINSLEAELRQARSHINMLNSLLEGKGNIGSINNIGKDLHTSYNDQYDDNISKGSVQRNL